MDMRRNADDKEERSSVSRLVALLSASGAPPEFARYVVVGSANTTLTYLIYLAGLWAGATPTVAYTISFVAGIFTSYCLNLKITFRRIHSWRKFLGFPLVYLVQYVAGLALLKILIHWGVSPALAGLLIVPALVPITFALMRVILK